MEFGHKMARDRIANMNLMRQIILSASTLYSMGASEGYRQPPLPGILYSTRSSEAGSIRTAWMTGRSAAKTAPARIASMGNTSICQSVAFT